MFCKGEGGMEEEKKGRVKRRWEQSWYPIQCAAIRKYSSTKSAISSKLHNVFV